MDAAVYQQECDMSIKTDCVQTLCNINKYSTTEFACNHTVLYLCSYVCCVHNGMQDINRFYLFVYIATID